MNDPNQFITITPHYSTLLQRTATRCLYIYKYIERTMNDPNQFRTITPHYSTLLQRTAPKPGAPRLELQGSAWVNTQPTKNSSHVWLGVARRSAWVRVGARCVWPLSSFFSDATATRAISSDVLSIPRSSLQEEGLEVTGKASSFLSSSTDRDNLAKSMVKTM